MAAVWASLTTFIWYVFGAGTLTSLMTVLPRVVTLAGLAILSSPQSAFESAFGGIRHFGALVALAVAATSFAVFGITSAFWAVLAGMAASFMAERQELYRYWRGDKAAKGED